MNRRRVLFLLSRYFELGGALHEFCLNGQVICVRALLDGGAPVNWRDPCELWTLLHFACMKGHVRVVRELLRRGADVNAACRFGIRALFFACRQGYVEVAQELLDSGADIEVADNRHEMTPLHLASRNNRTELVGVLLDRGADINAVDDCHETALFMACRADCLDVVRVLLHRGADAEICAGDVRSLHAACLAGNVEIVRELLSHGAAIEAPDDQPPLLHYIMDHSLSGSLQRNHLIIFNELLDHGADVNGRSAAGLTPLAAASRRHSLPFVELLLTIGAPVDLANMHGSTPLHEACSGPGDIGVVNALLDAGADVNHRDLRGLAAMDLACSEVLVDVVTLLLTRGADWEALVKKIRTIKGQRYRKRWAIKYLRQFSTASIVMK